MLVLDYGGTKLLHLYIRVFGGKHFLKYFNVNVPIMLTLEIDFRKVPFQI